MQQKHNSCYISHAESCFVQLERRLQHQWHCAPCSRACSNAAPVQIKSERRGAQCVHRMSHLGISVSDCSCFARNSSKLVTSRQSEPLGAHAVLRKRVCSRLSSPSVQVINDAQPEAFKFGWQTDERMQLAVSSTSQTCAWSRQQAVGVQSVIVALTKERSLLNCHNKCVKTDPLGTAERWSHQACQRCCQCMLWAVG